MSKVVCKSCRRLFEMKVGSGGICPACDNSESIEGGAPLGLFDPSSGVIEEGRLLPSEQARNWKADIPSESDRLLNVERKKGSIVGLYRESGLVEFKLRRDSTDFPLRKALFSQRRYWKFNGLREQEVTLTLGYSRLDDFPDAELYTLPRIVDAEK